MTDAPPPAASPSSAAAAEMGSERWRALAEHATDAVLLLDAQGIVTYASPSLLTVLGSPPQEYVGTLAFDHLHPDDQARARRLFGILFERPGETVRAEVRGRHRDGSWRLIEGIGANRLAEPAVGAVVVNIRDVTEARRAQEENRRTAALLAATFESTTDGILVVDARGHIAAHNERFAQMWRIPDSVLASKNDDQVIGFVLEQLVDPGAFLRKVQELYARPEAESHDTLRFKDGRVFERYSMPHRVDGAAEGRVWSFRDVTEQRRAAEAQRESEERYRAFIEQSSEGIWRFEMELPMPVSLPEDAQIDYFYRYGYLAECNDVMARMHGAERAAQLTGQRLADLLHREDHQTDGLLRAFIRSGYRLGDVETRGRPRDGHQHVYQNSFIGLVQDGLLLRAWGTQRDVTERARAARVQAATYRIAEAAITSDDLSTLFKSVHEIVADLMPAKNFYIALVDEKRGRLSFPYFVDEVDPGFESKPFGRGITEYVVRSGEPLLATPDVYQELERRGEVELIGAPSIDWLGVPLKVGERVIGALVVQTYTEGVRYGQEEARILSFVSAQVAMAIERRRSGDALRASEERYRTFIAQSSEGVSRIELDPPIPVTLPPEQQVDLIYDTGSIAECNDAMAHMYGFRQADELVGKRLGELHERTDPANRLAVRQFIAAGYRHTDSESHERDKDGRSRYFLNNSVGIVRDGHLVRVWGTQRDITEQKKLEDQLRQAQKMEAVGRLAGGVAHDFNNLLTAIIGNTQILSRTLGAGHPSQSDVDEIRKAADRAAGLTRQLLAYSRRQVLQPEVLDLNEVVREMERLLRRLIGEDVQLATHLAPGLGRVRADPGQVEQVIVNLAVNARDAMPHGGHLTIETSNVELGAAYREEHPGAFAGPGVQLAVTDSGIGMDAQTQAHLFEPFFTTKEVGKGTGLGLATVYGIVKQSGGYIAVYSEPGHGSSFKICLPRLRDPETATPAAGAAAAAPTGGSETILLVEDEDSVRTLSGRLLEAAGYRVLAAANGPAALQAAERHQGPIHLLLTDIVMPEMSGPELSVRLATLRPGVRVLYMSGYPGEAVVHRGALTPGVAFLQKPFLPEVLEGKVREVLDQR